jgi:photosystem I P700 chlorophyll a apoprotein A1
MTISSKEREVKKARILVDRDIVDTSFEKWAKPGHFSRTLAKGPKTTTWIWNLHADAHDFDTQTNSLEDISRKIFSAHFGQLAIIFFWVSGMHFHGAYFSNYSAWLANPTTIKQSTQVVWPIVGQEILNGDVGVISKVFKLRLDSSKFGVLKVLQVKSNCIGQLSVD